MFEGGCQALDSLAIGSNDGAFNCHVQQSTARVVASPDCPIGPYASGHALEMRPQPPVEGKLPIDA